jgi:hypothetical protein
MLCKTHVPTDICRQVDAVDEEYGWSMLMWAARAGYRKHVEALLAAGSKASLESTKEYWLNGRVFPAVSAPSWPSNWLPRVRVDARMPPGCAGLQCAGYRAHRGAAGGAGGADAGGGADRSTGRRRRPDGVGDAPHDTIYIQPRAGDVHGRAIRSYPLRSREGGVMTDR